VCIIRRAVNGGWGVGGEYSIKIREREKKKHHTHNPPLPFH